MTADTPEARKALAIEIEDSYSGNFLEDMHPLSKIDREMIVAALRSQPGMAREEEPVAWLDLRTAGLSWQNRLVATNPQFVENNGPENFAPLCIGPFQLNPDSSKPLAWHCCDDRYPFIRDLVTTNEVTIEAWRESGIDFQPLYPLTRPSSNTEAD